MELYFQSNSVMNSLKGLGQSDWAAASLNYSQSIKIDIGQSDGGTIIFN